MATDTVIPEVVQVLDITDEQLAAFGEEYAPKALVLQKELALEKIPDDETYARVAKAGLDAAANIKSIESLLTPLKERRYAAWKRVCDVLKGKTQPFEDIKKKASRLVGAYQNEVQQKRLAAEAAERERIRLEEERRRAQEAENLAAEGRIEEGIAVLESNQAPVAPVVSSYSAPKVGGVSKAKETYKITVVNLMELVKAVAEGKVPLLAIQADEAWLKKQANQLQQFFNYPGVKAERDFSSSFRA